MFPVADVIPSRTTPYVTIGIILLGTVAFLYELRLDYFELRRLVGTHGVVPADFQWPTVVTSLFLHAGWLHLLGNVLYLWIFGDNIEDRFGHGRYLLFYLSCGAAAALGHAAVNPLSRVPLIGASGAVAGVMGAYFVFYPHSRVLTAVVLVFYLDLIEVPAIFFLGIWFLLQLFSGVGSLGAGAAHGSTAFWAHVTGFATGALFGGAVRIRHAKRWPRWEH